MRASATDGAHGRAVATSRCAWYRAPTASRSATLALAVDPHSYEVQWRMARAYFWVAYTQPSRVAKKALAAKALEWAERAVSEQPDRVEGHYFYAVALGEYASTIGVMQAVVDGVAGKVESAAQRAYAIDRDFTSRRARDGAGPLLLPVAVAEAGSGQIARVSRGSRRPPPARAARPRIIWPRRITSSASARRRASSSPSCSPTTRNRAPSSIGRRRSRWRARRCERWFRDDGCDRLAYLSAALEGAAAEPAAWPDDGCDARRSGAVRRLRRRRWSPAPCASAVSCRELADSSAAPVGSAHVASLRRAAGRSRRRRSPRRDAVDEAADVLHPHRHARGAGATRARSGDAGGAPSAAVVAAISPFGLSGPRAEWRSCDTVAQALGGMLFVNGHRRRAAAARDGAAGVPCAPGCRRRSASCSALLARRRSGRGQVVDVSVLESVVARSST